MDKPSIFKNLTVILKSGREVTVGVYVRGNKSSKSFQITGVDTDIPDFGNDRKKLSQVEKDEVEKLVGEKIDKESWKL
jgi:hypothetical protein